MSDDAEIQKSRREASRFTRYEIKSIEEVTTRRSAVKSETRREHNLKGSQTTQGDISKSRTGTIRKRPVSFATSASIIPETSTMRPLDRYRLGQRRFSEKGGETYKEAIKHRTLGKRSE